jgi:hypothetical protein
MGGICAVIGSTSLHHSARLVRRGRRATGTVIAYQQTDSWSRDSRGLSQRDPFFHPVVEFTDDAGVIHRVQIELGAQRLELAHGESVRIVYEPDKMHEAQIESFGQLSGALATVRGAP